MQSTDKADYLETRFDLDDRDFVSTIDELTLWSAPFGLLLLEHVRLRRGIKVLDMGCGMGFPAIELAQRLGVASTVYGIDLWSAALERGRHKIRNHRVTNVRLIEGDASATDFADGYFDLVVSNLGLNNFAAPEKVLSECRRLLQPDGQLVLTTNFKGHMEEFYALFQQTLTEMDMDECRIALEAHIDHRLSLETATRLLEGAGFRVGRTVCESFNMRFLDGSALLRHYFIRLGFMDGWKNVLPEDRRSSFFAILEEKLNHLAESNGELDLTIPMGYIEAGPT